MAYTQSQIQAAESMMKPTMTKEELDDYNALTPDEQTEYVSGFIDNLKEWKKSYMDQQQQQQPGGMPGPQPEIPDDGLQHWMPNPQQSDGQSSSEDNDHRQKIYDASKQAQDAAKQAQQDAQDAQDAAKSGDAQQAADAAQQAAQSAQAAAQAAQNAANEAASKAMSSDDKNVQNAANAAQDAADQAQQAADKAEAAADKAQEAADNGDAQGAAKAAQQAAKAAQQAASKANQAANNANQAADDDAQGSDQSQDAAQRAADAAQRAQQAAAAGDTEGAKQAAQEAADAAQEAAQGANRSANQAQQAAQSAAGQQSGQQGGQSGQSGQSGQQGGQQGSQSGQGAGGSEGKAAAQAAQAAQQAADAAQQAANNAQDTANDSTTSAQQAAQAAKKAAQAAQAAADAAEAADQAAEDVANNSEYKSAQTGHSQRIDNSKNGGKRDTSNPQPTLSEPSHKSSFTGKVDRSFDFGGNDVLGEEDYEKAKEIAERAGQPVDSDDYDSPETTAAKKYSTAKKELRKWQEHNNPGFGNSPIVLADTLDSLFAKTIDWKDRLRDFMTGIKLENVEDVMAKRYMGLDPTHAKYGSRYLHPYEERSPKRAGIAEVFFLVDASGSMGFTCGDGRDVFEHIMNEFIQLEMEEDINRSAYAPFNTGPIDEDDIICWTKDDAPDEDEIREKLPLPQAGGGTSALDGVKCINNYDEIYDKETTLLIIATDGIDDYSQIKKVMTSTQLSNTVFVITQSSDSGLEAKKKELVGYGIEPDHVITVNVETEWGAGE